MIKIEIDNRMAHLEYCRAELNPDCWIELNGKIIIQLPDAQAVYALGVDMGKKCW